MHFQDRMEMALQMHKSDGQYRIQWKSLLTGYKSHGDWFSMDKKQMLEITVKKMNETYKNEIVHWLVEGV